MPDLLSGRCNLLYRVWKGKIILLSSSVTAIERDIHIH